MKNSINFYDGFVQDDIIWFSSLNHNALMTLDIKSGKIDLIGLFPECKSYQNNMHIRVIENHKRLYFVPRYGNLIHVFNLESVTFEENVLLPYPVNTWIANAIIDVYGVIWIIPAHFCDGIVVLDTDKKIVEKLTRTDSLNLPSDAFIGPNCVCYNKGIISIGIFKSNILLYINTISYEVNSEKISEEYNPYSFISDDGENFFFSNYPDNRIMSWNKNEKTYTTITDKIDCDAAAYLYWNYIIRGNRILCMPCDINDVLIVDLVDKSQKHIPVNKMVKINSVNPMYTFYKEYKGSFYFFPSGADGLLIIDGNDLSVRKLNYVISDDLQKQIQAERKENFRNEMLSGIASENIEYDETLGEFLDFVTQNNRREVSSDRPDYGRRIYESVKRIIS